MGGFGLTTPISALQGFASTAPHNYKKLNASASIASWILEPNALAGLYRAQLYMATNVPGAGSVIATVTWTDDVGVKNIVIPATLALTANSVATSPPVLLQVAQGPISFSTTYSPDGAYNIYVVLERIL